MDEQDEQATPSLPPQVLQARKPAKLEIPKDLHLTYADVVLVQQTPDSARLLFFQSKLPVAQSQEEIAAVESVPTVCVAQIVVPFNVVDRIVDAWQARKRAEATK